MFLEKIKKRFTGNPRVPKVYFAKSVNGVGANAIIFFPVYRCRLNCGITGIITYKKGGATPPKIPMKRLESVILQMRKYALKKIKGASGLAKHYLGGEASVTELGDLIQGLKDPDTLYTLFKDASLREKLQEFSRVLGTLIDEEQDQHHRMLGLLPLEENEVIINRVTQLRDLHWCIAEEIVKNLEKIEGLSNSALNEIDLPAFRQLKHINTLLNNIDRLEVRGRDSAGISLITVLEKAVFRVFEEEVAKRGWLDEFHARQEGTILLNRHITVNNAQETASITFTYKIAAQIGHLGDNVRYLREQIHGDGILQLLIANPSIYQTMLAHTRWASVGEISEPNCHPVDNILEYHENGLAREGSAGTIHVCLNGDIDNYEALKEAFENDTGRSIPGQITTDTKIIPLQVENYYRSGHSIEESFRLAVNDFTGSHAIAMHTDLAPGKLFLALRGSGQALFVGLAKEHYIVASEIYGLVEETSRYIKLDSEGWVDGQRGKNGGQIVILGQDSPGELPGIKAFHYNGSPIRLTRESIHRTEITTRDIDRRNFSHFFLKEIYESPQSVEKTIQGAWSIAQENGSPHPVSVLGNTAITPSLKEAFQGGRIRRILFIGQGTAGIAACGCAELVKAYLPDRTLHIAPLKASEFSGELTNEDLHDTLVIAITQSGTTTDTNMAVDMARERGAHTMAIVNRRDSDITFKADGVLYTSTGRDIEMSVASTKAYYSQIAAGGMLGLALAQLLGAMDDDLILGELQRLMRIPSLMKKVLEREEEIARSANTYAPTKKYWAVVGSGYNKITADEVRIKSSELCYKTISSDVVEDKKHIDLSSEPLIVVCAAGNKGNVINDIIKDTAIFKAHKATTIVIATEGEERFRRYADSLLYVPDIEERFAPILTTLAGHLWGYHAARAIHNESRFLFDFQQEINAYVSESLKKGMDIYRVALDHGLQEKTAKFFSRFKQRLEDKRYAAAMELKTASDLTLLLKYLSGRLPISDFELDFGISGTAPNMFDIFFRCIGEAIDEMARPIDAIKHQAKTVTVGTSRIWKPIEGLIFETLKKNGFGVSNLSNKNVLVLKNLQEIIAEKKGETLYEIRNLTFTGEPVENSMIKLLKKTGSSSKLISRAESG
ncbi:MAG: SIS domain-containing protein, partial [Deltaproteobacteria bacterium]|nr:SIS domain-containing protein [Deltaproteobacteria bacterium]MBW2076686.1 SIS domain-containing protein [Deltaproteobacteria bacterium]